MPPERLDMTGLEEEILTSIRRIVRAIELYSHSLVSQVGLTSPQLSVLKSVARLSPATPTAIARQLSLSQPTVSGILERLQGKNLVQRVATGGDKRMHSYALTDQAQLQMASSPPLLQESFLQRLSQLQDWERSMLLSALQRVANLMDVETLEAQPSLNSAAELDGKP
ncbi:MAG: winged helix-turn-helix transcriptional regulator [Candidatus Eremiobacteraeota bacterium]|nr:winged helix-turn-helix transcriptional regulator [Candidatus Eremiobacteraeota bacterium]MCW5870331.1 winged helix-turn-helix transcriptional regulator [Candidatus Eremiobacteraeota bacterium]